MPDAHRHGRYRAEDPAELLIRPFDELTLIYHRRSGVTHMVSEPVPEILTAMGQDTLSPAQILLRLSRDFDLETEETEALSGVLAARLQELVALGLVERL